MQFLLTDERLNQLAGMIHEIPTKYGCPLVVLLNQWHNEAIAEAQKAAAADAQPESETTVT